MYKNQTKDSPNSPSSFFFVKSSLTFLPFVSPMKMKAVNNQHQAKIVKYMINIPDPFEILGLPTAGLTNRDGGLIPLGLVEAEALIPTPQNLEKHKLDKK